MKFKYILLFMLANSLAYTNVCIAQAGIITTIAGNGAAGFSGDGGPAVAAHLNTPISIVLDTAGNIYFSDHNNNRIRRINIAGIISTYAGDGIIGYSGDGGAATAAKMYNPTGVAVDNSGNLYFSDEQNNVIRMVNDTGIISTIAGNDTAAYSGDGGPATAAECYLPYEVTVDHAGNIYIVDQDNNRIRKVNTLGIITTVAGNGVFGYSGDGGPATAAQVYYPTGIKMDDRSGNLYIADKGNNLIRKVDSLGIITTIAGNNFYGFSGDGGPATAAELAYPSSVAVDRFGNVFFSDSYNDRIRKIDTSGIITTVAGNGTHGFSGDGGPAINAAFRDPMGIAIDDSENLFIADVFNNAIRKVKIHLPPPTGIAQATFSKSTISLFPDPNNGNFILSYNQQAANKTDEPISVEVMNMIGKIVYKNILVSKQGKLNARIKLDDNLPVGMYLLNLRSETETTTMHFAIEK